LLTVTFLGIQRASLYLELILLSYELFLRCLDVIIPVLFSASAITSCSSNFSPSSLMHSAVRLKPFGHGGGVAPAANTLRATSQPSDNRFNEIMKKEWIGVTRVSSSPSTTVDETAMNSSDSRLASTPSLASASGVDFARLMFPSSHHNPFEILGLHSSPVGSSSVPNAYFMSGHDSTRHLHEANGLNEKSDDYFNFTGGD
ncbi:hypothetical protein PMAYCL1PPCAC_18657, partial [Pristionchus mayeri]